MVRHVARVFCAAALSGAAAAVLVAGPLTASAAVPIFRSLDISAYLLALAG